MPNVRTLEGEPQVDRKADVATVDAAMLAKPPANSNSELAVPGAFGRLVGYQKSEDVEVPQSEAAIYVGFASTKSPSWPTQSAAGLTDGDIHIAYNRGLTKLMPMTFWLYTHETFKTVMLQSGEISYATRDTTKHAVPPGIPGRKLETHLVGVAIVDVNGQLVPSKIEARGTKEGCLSGAILAIKQAMDPKWPSLSDAHKVAAAFTFPWGRVANIANTIPKTVQSGENKGAPYKVGTCLSKPSTIEQMKKLTEAFSDKQFQVDAEIAVRAFETRVQQLDNIATQFANR
jgi:hypothetical protein